MGGLWWFMEAFGDSWGDGHAFLYHFFDVKTKGTGFWPIPHGTSLKTKHDLTWSTVNVHFSNYLRRKSSEKSATIILLYFRGEGNGCGNVCTAAFARWSWWEFPLFFLGWPWIHCEKSSVSTINIYGGCTQFSAIIRIIYNYIYMYITILIH